jgi:hypothetical protein
MNKTGVDAKPEVQEEQNEEAKVSNLPGEDLTG